jgi:hypothetical protein
MVTVTGVSDTSDQKASQRGSITGCDWAWRIGAPVAADPRGYLTEALHSLAVHKERPVRPAWRTVASVLRLCWVSPSRRAGRGVQAEACGGALLSDPDLVEQRPVHRLLLLVADLGGYEDCR